MMDLWRHIDRRQFLRRAALALPALHGGLAMAGSAKAGDESTDGSNPVEFRELGLRTHRLDEVKTFYRETMELGVREDGDAVVVEAGKTRLRFTVAEAGSEPFYHFAFTIPENKLPRAMEWMESRCPLLYHRRSGGHVVHFRSWDAHSVYFNDPAGNIVEFIAHHRLPNAASGAFSSADILYASEIGLVVPNVSKVVDALERELGLGVYIDSWPNFAPVGNVYGVFIVVREDRVWLPTDDVEAAVFPTAAEVAGIDGSGLDLEDLPYRIRRAA